MKTVQAAAIDAVTLRSVYNYFIEHIHDKLLPLLVLVHKQQANPCVGRLYSPRPFAM
jgi:hypothetical protein